VIGPAVTVAEAVDDDKGGTDGSVGATETAGVVATPGGPRSGPIFCFAALAGVLEGGVKPFDNVVGSVGVLDGGGGDVVDGVNVPTVDEGGNDGVVPFVECTPGVVF
jgi:hypothetical protein